MSDANEYDYLDLVTPFSTVIEPAIKVDDADAFQWDDECDMLVLGAGLAGSSAALKGAELGGMDIILADRFRGGGASSLSGGVVYAGGGTRVQKEMGVEDTPEAMAEYLAHEVQGVKSPETVRRFCESSPKIIDWLEERGPHYGGPLYRSKTSYPPPDYFLYFSGNEKAIPYLGQKGAPAQRGHRTKAADPSLNFVQSGPVLMAAIGETVARTPEIRRVYQSTARRLIVDKEGRVIGAELGRIEPGTSEAEKHAKLHDNSRNPRKSIFGLNNGKWKKLTALEKAHAKPYRIRARRGVVVALGGFGFNRRMVEKALPIYKDARGLGTQGDDGSAVRLGQTVGARLGNMNKRSCWRFLSPPFNWIKGVTVDGKGSRLVNEELYGARIGGALFENAEGKGWLIIDSEIHAAASEDRKTLGWAHQKMPIAMAMLFAKKAGSIAALEAKLGMAKGALVKTIEGYNADIAAGRPDQMLKGDEYRKPIDKGPFYAVNIGAKSFLNPISSITLGGLDVDEQTNQVFAKSGDPIPGLYAAGRSAVGICSTNYVSGLSLADCVWSGWQSASAIAGNRPPAS